MSRWSGFCPTNFSRSRSIPPASLPSPRSPTPPARWSRDLRRRKHWRSTRPRGSASDRPRQRSLERALFLKRIPFGDFALEVRGEFLRRAADEAIAELGPALLHLGHRQDLLQIAVDLVDDRPRRALGREERIPARLFAHLDAELAQGRADR